MHSTGQRVSRSSVEYVVVLQLFSLASYFLHTECRHLSVHHGRRPFWGSEFCSGAEFVEVLPQNTDKETHTQKKRHKSVLF